MQYLTLFVGLWLWRYVRLLVNVVSAWTLKPTLPMLYPSFTAKDVTVVLATLGKDKGDLQRCISSIAKCDPNTIIIVTPSPKVGRLRQVCKRIGSIGKVRILGADKANKRLQMVQGLRQSKTAITIFADDDVFWPESLITYILAPFEDSNVGAVGPYTSLHRPSNPNCWDFLSACYLERWNFEIAATYHMDGGIPCLGGRTSAIRTKIAQSQEFVKEFTTEKWLGLVPLLKADDDNFITRYLVNHGWKIVIQSAEESRVTTTLESDSKFLGQCERWYRTTWRSNITSLFVDRVIWRAQPWSAYALHLSTFSPPALVMDSALAYLLDRAIEAVIPEQRVASRSMALVMFLFWLAFAKTVKLWLHFYRYPSDLRYLPVLFAFGYFHGALKLRALCTLHKTSWDGGRVLAGGAS